MKNLYDGVNVQSLGRRVIPFGGGVRSVQEIVSGEAQRIAERLGSDYHVGCEAGKYATIVSGKLPNSAITVLAIRFTGGNGSMEDVLQLSVEIEGMYREEQADEIIGRITDARSGLGYLPTNAPAIPAGSFARMG